MEHESSQPKPALVDVLTAPLQRFLAIEASSTIVLVFATLLALVWANSPWHAGYDRLLHTYDFTMALFITALAFDDASMIAASKVGIFVASLLALLVGLAVLARVLPARRSD